MSVKPITNSLPISYEGEGLPLLKQIAQDTHTVSYTHLTLPTIRLV